MRKKLALLETSVPTHIELKGTDFELAEIHDWIIF